jgi:tRNA G46 methylase TrmB
VHPGLGARVLRQASSAWRKPAREVDRPALQAIDRAISTHRGPVVLDSFCGTGMSTAQLAAEHPGALVIGVDQSAHRLGKSPGLPSNGLLVRAHCEAVWQHLVNTGVRLERHTILYPNPWPKPAHLGRRIHGHPAFGLLPLLGGHLELRSNWQIYVEEFGLALNLLGHASHVAVVSQNKAPTTLFERKYRASGHPLWCVNARFAR